MQRRKEKKGERNNDHTLPNERNARLARHGRTNHNVYNESIDKLCELEQSGKVFIIRPSEPITISRTERNPDRLKSVYELGRKDMEMYLEGLEEFLEKEQEI